MSWSDDLNACAAIVEKGDPARFRTVMAAPLAARKILFPLYAFNVEVARAPRVTVEPMIAEIRLQWWRDALEEIAGDGPVRRHEVVTPLAEVLGAAQVAVLDTLIEARRWDCYRDPFEDQAALQRYLEETSGGLMQVASVLLGGPEAAARDAGTGLGVANWLRACPGLEAEGRVPLVDGTAEGVRAFGTWGLSRLSTARVPVPRKAYPAFWSATGTARVLRKVVSDPGRVASGQVPEPSRLALAFKAFVGGW